MKRHAILYFVLSSATALPGTAEEDPSQTLPEVVITANRVEQDTSRLGVSYSLISGEDLDILQVNGIADGLQDAPGVFIRQTGGTGAATTLNIRGNRDQDSLIRVDYAKGSGGVITGFTPFLAYAQPLNIEQIEIIPGPQSVLYGSDTMGGVVSVMTRKGQGDPSLSLSAEAGSFSTFQSALQGQGTYDRYAWSFHGAWLQTDNELPQNEYRNFDFSGRLDVALNDAWELGVMTRGHRADYEDPPVPDFLIGAAAVKTNNTGASTYLRGDLQPNWQTQATVSWFEEDYDGDFDGFAYLADSHVWQADWENTIQVNSAYRVVAGASVEFARQKDNFFANGYEESTHSGVYMQNVYEPGSPLSLTLGLRYDWIQRFSDPFTWRASAAWQLPNARTKLRAAAGSSFRVPNVFQLFSSFAGAANPDLKPETALSWEVGLDHLWDDRGSRFSVTAFYNDIENLIVDVDPDPRVVRAENRDTARTYGIELATAAQLWDNLSLTGAYTWQQAESTDRTVNPTLTEDRLNLPEHQVDATILLSLPQQVQLGAGFHVISGLKGNYATFLDPPDIRSTAYTVLRLFGQWQATEALRLTGRIENLFDESYQPTPGYPANGIGAYLGFVWDI